MTHTTHRYDSTGFDWTVGAFSAAVALLAGLLAIGQFAQVAIL